MVGFSAADYFGVRRMPAAWIHRLPRSQPGYPLPAVELIAFVVSALGLAVSRLASVLMVPAVAAHHVAAVPATASAFLHIEAAGLADSPNQTGRANRHLSFSFHGRTRYSRHCPSSLSCKNHSNCGNVLAATFSFTMASSHAFFPLTSWQISFRPSHTTQSVQ